MDKSRVGFWVNIGLLLGSVVFVTVLLEIGLRVMLSDAAQQALPQPFINENVQQRLRWQARRANQVVAEQYSFDLHDPLLGWRLRPNAAVRSVKANSYDVWVRSNAQGLRGVEPVALTKSEGTSRIGIFGCSLTFGEGVNDAETYSAQLQTLLPETQVLNFGVHGYGTDQMLLLYETEGQQYQLDVVILAFAWFHMRRNANAFHFFAKPKYDLLPSGQLHLRPQSIPTPVELAQQPLTGSGLQLANQSVLLRWGWQRIRNRRERQLYQVDSEAWALTQALIRQFAEHAKALGTQVVLMSVDESQPHLDEALETLAGELQVGFLNLGPLFRSYNDSGYPYRLSNDGHWNAKGHHAVATAIRDYLSGDN